MPREQLRIASLRRAVRAREINRDRAQVRADQQERVALELTARQRAARQRVDSAAAAVGGRAGDVRTVRQLRFLELLRDEAGQHHADVAAEHARARDRAAESRRILAAAEGSVRAAEKALARLVAQLQRRVERMETRQLDDLASRSSACNQTEPEVAR